MKGAVLLAAALASSGLPAETADPSRTGAVEIAYIQQSIPVGMIRSADRWLCTAIVGDTKYFSTGTMEMKARARLDAYASSGVDCWLRGFVRF